MWRKLRISCQAGLKCAREKDAREMLACTGETESLAKTGQILQILKEIHLLCTYSGHNPGKNHSQS